MQCSHSKNEIMVVRHTFSTNFFKPCETSFSDPRSLDIEGPIKWGLSGPSMHLRVRPCMCAYVCE